MREAHQYWHYEKEGRQIIEFLSSLDKVTPTIAKAHPLDVKNSAEALTDFLDPHCSYDRFMDPGNEKLLDLRLSKISPKRRASQGLPPDVVQKIILANVFRTTFQEVDFQQSLTGLDYLRDLEETRKCSQREAAGRLGITHHNWRDVLAGDRSALAWVEKVLENETIIEGYYARISVNLRIWVSQAAQNRPAES